MQHPMDESGRLKEEMPLIKVLRADSCQRSWTHNDARFKNLPSTAAKTELTLVLAHPPGDHQS